MKGLTLLEVLIVVTIVALMASTAFPLYMRAVARSRESEGWVLLTAIRSSELRYYDEHDEIFTTTASQLDLDAATTPLFTSCIKQSGVTNFTAYALPKAVCSYCHRFSLNNAGTRVDPDGTACP